MASPIVTPVESPILPRSEPSAAPILSQPVGDQTSAPPSIHRELSRSSTASNVSSANSVRSSSVSSAATSESAAGSALSALGSRSKNSSQTSFDPDLGSTSESYTLAADAPRVELAVPVVPALPNGEGNLVALRGRVVFRGAASFVSGPESSLGVHLEIPAGADVTLQAETLIPSRPAAFQVAQRNSASLIAYSNRLFLEVAKLAGMVGHGVHLDSTAPLHVAATISGWRMHIAKLSNVVYGGPSGLSVGGALFRSQWLMDFAMAGVRRFAPLPMVRPGEPARATIEKVVIDAGPKVREALDWEPAYTALRELTQTVDYGGLVLSDMSMLLPSMVHTTAQHQRTLTMQPFAEAEMLEFARDSVRGGMAVDLPRVGFTLSDSSGDLAPLRVGFRGDAYLNLIGAESLRQLTHTHGAHPQARVQGELQLGSAQNDATADQSVAQVSVGLRRGYVTLRQRLALPEGALTDSLGMWVAELLEGRQPLLVAGIAALRSLSLTELSLNAPHAVRAAKHAGFGDGIAGHHGATDPTLAGLLVGLTALPRSAIEMGTLVASESKLTVLAQLKPMRIRLSESAVTSSMTMSNSIEMRVRNAGQFTIESEAPAAPRSTSIGARLGAALGSVAKFAWGGAQWVAKLLWRALCSPYALVARLVRGPAAPATALLPASLEFAPVLAQPWAKSLFGQRGLRLGWLADVRVDGLVVTNEGRVRPKGAIRLFHIPVFSLDKKFIANAFMPRVPFGDGVEAYLALAPKPARATKPSLDIAAYVALCQQLVTSASVSLAPRADASKLTIDAPDGGGPLQLERGPIAMSANFVPGQAPAFSLDAMTMRLSRAYPFAGHATADEVAVSLDIHAQARGDGRLNEPGAAPQVVAMQVHADVEQVVHQGREAPSLIRISGMQAGFGATVGASDIDFDVEAQIGGSRKGHRSLLEQVGDHDSLRWLMARKVKAEGRLSVPALLAMAQTAAF